MGYLVLIFCFSFLFFISFYLIFRNIYNDIKRIDARICDLIEMNARTTRILVLNENEMIDLRKSIDRLASKKG